METVQLVAIDENTIETMVTKMVSEDIEVVFCKETNHGTIFFGELEIECMYTPNVDLEVSQLKHASLFKKVSTLQRIERYHQIA